MNVLVYIGYFFLFFGVVFLFLGALGLYRLPDLYSRMQASTKTTTLGAFSFILGIGIMQPQWLPKAILIALFIFLTNPISSSALIRAAYKRNVEFVSFTQMDKGKEFFSVKEAK